MGIFSNPFRSTPNTNQWPTIAASISSGFQDVKRQWFNDCVAAVDLGLLLDNEEKTKVVHTTLAGDGALAVTGYQICCASSTIAGNGYIPKRSAKDFLDLLWGQVSGVETRELLKYTRRYDEVSRDTSTQHFRLGVDVGRYLINGEPSMIVSLHVASRVQQLAAQTCMVIADAFGDLPRVHKLSRQIALAR
jgi:hypothetical protein